MIFPSNDPIFEERIEAIRHRLMLIQTAVSADEEAMSFESDEIQGAIWTATAEALDLLNPIRQNMKDMPSEWKESESLAGSTKKGRSR